MMNFVLFTASTYSHIANFHRPYLRAFHELGWKVHVACGGTPMSIPEADEVIPLPFEKQMSSPANFRAQKQLREAMNRYHYTLVCTHTSLAAFFTRRAAAGLNTSRPPVVNVVHGYLFHKQTPPIKKAILLTAEKMTAPQTDLLLTMNQWDHDAALRHHLGRVTVNIPGIGVDFSRFLPVSWEQRLDLRESLGYGGNDFVLIYAAEFSARKNQAMLIHALPELPQRVKLLLPGQGALLEPCRSLARRLGVDNRICFPGQLSDMPRWYGAVDAAVSSSRSEGLPFNIMEAMYCGLPVVASAVKGHTDLIQDGGNGLLYPCNDPHAFARQVSVLLGDPGYCTSMGGAAQTNIAPYALETVLPQVMQAYLSIVKEAALPLLTH